MIMEGNHLIPKLYHHIECDLFLMLGAPDIDEHRRRLLGQTHAKRPLSETDLARARAIDEYLRCEAAHYAIPCMRYDGDPDSIVQALLG